MSALVHGIVSLDPPTVRCDGCGHEAVGEPGRLNLLILSCRILFNPGRYGSGDTRRLCEACAEAAGWTL